MNKENWKKCSCGIITDVDEEYCPKRGLKENPEHKLQIVELNRKEVKELLKKGKVYTKNWTDLERKLFQ